MKKLIAISVVFALVAVAAFAQAAVGGGVETRFTLFRGNDVSGQKPSTIGGIGGASIRLSGQNADGTLGGMFNLRNTDIVRDAAWFHRVFVWWQPISAVRIFLGIDQDGKFATDALEGWGFHQGGGDYMGFQHWDFWRAIFPGNWDGFGLAFSFYPVDGLDINLVIPTGETGWPQATNANVRKSREIGDMYVAGLRLQVGYALPDIGKIFFSYVGPEVKFSATDTFGGIGLSFNLTMLQGLQIHIGGSMDIPKSGAKEPIKAGLGVQWSGGDFGVNFRTGLLFGQGTAGGRPNTAVWTGGSSSSMFFNAQVLPYYNFGFMTFFLDFGLSMDKQGSTGTAWWAVPYVKVPISGGLFSIGFQIMSNVNAQIGDVGNIMVQGDKVMKFGVPLSLSYSF
jgi:hypothetical protein